VPITAMAYVKVRVITGMRKEKVKRVDEVTFEMTIKEPAERNLANKRIRALLSQELSVPEGKIKIITGHHSPSKMFDVTIED